jgi:hypothetical protein
VSDNIFHEVDEEVRRERLKNLWDQYGTYIVILAFLFVVAIAGWRGYEWWEAKHAAEAGTAFEAAVELADQGKHEEAQAAFQKLANEGTSGYRKLARLREAIALSQRDPQAAISAFDAIAGDTSMGKDLQDLAAIRAAFLAADHSTPEELRRRLEPLATPDGTYRHSARDMLALAAWKANDAAALKRIGETVNTDPQTPGSLRARIDLLTALLAAEGKS